MKSAKRIRSGYLFAIPLVLVILILYSGALQMFLPAVSVNGTDYRIAELNYYYFSLYHELVENELWLHQTGFQPETAESEQFCQEGETWRDWFLSQAKVRLARTAYYSGLARAEGYSDAGAEQLTQARRAEIDSFCQLNHIPEDNYFKAYYGSGMTAETYFAHYKEEVYAAYYRNHLLEQRPVSEAEIAAYCQEHGLEEYRTANLYLLTMDAPADRYTGLVGPDQLEQHQRKLDALEERFASGESTFQALYDAFSDCKTENGTGLYENASRYELPGVIVSWLYGAHPQPDDYFAVLSPEDGRAYLAVFSGWGAPGAELEAAQAIRQRKTDEEEQAALNSAYQTREYALGLRFAAS